MMYVISRMSHVLWAAKNHITLNVKELPTAWGLLIHVTSFLSPNRLNQGTPPDPELGQIIPN